MRPDRQKLRATQKSGTKNQAKELAGDKQPKAASKQGHPSEPTGAESMQRQDASHGKVDSARKH